MEEKSRLRIYVDERESRSEVPVYLRKRGAAIVWRNLDVGDYLVSERVAIERKTVNDLVKSVFDGRFFDQLTRLVEAYESPVLVVEGDLTKARKFTSRWNAVLGALTSAVMEFNVPALFSTSPEDTASIILFIARKERSGKKGVRMVVHKKPKLESIEDWQLYIVQSLPFVGPKTAQRLLEKFGNVQRVFTASIAELSKVEGIGEKKAATIVRILRSPYAPSRKQQQQRNASIEEFMKASKEEESSG